VLLHFAVVKVQKGDSGKTVGVEYNAKGDVAGNLEEIAQRLREKWQLEDVVLLRRAGKVGIGEIISLIAVNSPNSKDAFDACQFGIECLKKMPTISKKEIYAL
jgi:molybdopterin synthase catalytic subunit